MELAGSHPPVAIPAIRQVQIGVEDRQTGRPVGEREIPWRSSSGGDNPARSLQTPPDLRADDLDRFPRRLRTCSLEQGAPDSPFYGNSDQPLLDHVTEHVACLTWLLWAKGRTRGHRAIIGIRILLLDEDAESADDFPTLRVQVAKRLLLDLQLPGAALAPLLVFLVVMFVSIF